MSNKLGESIELDELKVSAQASKCCILSLEESLKCLNEKLKMTSAEADCKDILVKVC
jgi:hypothetical protein